MKNLILNIIKLLEFLHYSLQGEIKLDRGQEVKI